MALAFFEAFLFFFFFFFFFKQDEHEWDTNRDIFFIINTNLKLCTCTYVKPAVEGIEPKSCLVKHSTPYLWAIVWHLSRRTVRMKKVEKTWLYIESRRAEVERVDQSERGKQHVFILTVLLDKCQTKSFEEYEHTTERYWFVGFEKSVS